MIPAPVRSGRDYRKVPEKRLAARLDVEKYEVEAPLQSDEFWKQKALIRKVRIPLSQHIGAPAVAVVEKGRSVKTGDEIAAPANGLSVGIHASIDGVVQEVTDRYIVIADV